MILYHFTDGSSTNTMDEGLGLKAQSMMREWHVPLDVVWLTTEESDDWWQDGSKRKFRVTVVIPSTDKRLVRFQRWFKKTYPPKTREKMRKDPRLPQGVWAAMKSWYMYLGDAPLSKIRAIENC